MNITASTKRFCAAMKAATSATKRLACSLGRLKRDPATIRAADIERVFSVCKKHHRDRITVEEWMGRGQPVPAAYVKAIFGELERKGIIEPPGRQGKRTHVFETKVGP